MSSPLKRKLTDKSYQDPDYPQFSEESHVSPSKKPKAVFSQAEKETKIRQIINKEFQSSLTGKEEEVLEIDRRIVKAKRLLHRLRYAIVYDFYSKCEKPDGSEARPEQIIKPIHPAVKQLIGKRPQNLDTFIHRPMRKAARNASTTISEKLKRYKHQNYAEEVPKIEDNGIEEEQFSKINSSRGRNQVKHLIAVGNTSKFIGFENATDQVTHKWLVYVRTKSKVPVEGIIEKVRFFLHPSYAPNDIVDVTSPPFTLSRRGWGEFDLRVLLYFLPETNQKPIQIFHKLILDKSKTGLQTMGAETTVEVWLSGEIQDQNIEKLNPKNTEMHTNHKVETFTKQTLYKNNIEVIPKTKSMSSNLNVKNIPNVPDKSCSVNPKETWKHLDHSYAKSIDLNPKHSPSPDQNTKECFEAKSSPFEQKIEMELKNCNFNSTQKAVEFLFQKLPLINKNPESSFSFSVSNELTFSNLPFWKQRGLEWNRAKMINKILKSIPQMHLWTTKEIVLFAEGHGYCSKQVSKVNDTEKLDALKEYSGSLEDITNWIESKYMQHSDVSSSNHELLDVVSVCDNPQNSQHLTNNSKNIKIDQGCELENQMVIQLCSQIGICLDPETTNDGDRLPPAHKLLTEVSRRFVEDILRRALTCKSSFQEEIQPIDIQNAIASRSEFDFLTTQHLEPESIKTMKQETS